MLWSRPRPLTSALGKCCSWCLPGSTGPGSAAVLDSYQMRLWAGGSGGHLPSCVFLLVLKAGHRAAFRPLPSSCGRASSTAPVVFSALFGFETPLCGQRREARGLEAGDPGGGAWRPWGRGLEAGGPGGGAWRLGALGEGPGAGGPGGGVWRLGALGEGPGAGVLGLFEVQTVPALALSW